MKITIVTKKSSWHIEQLISESHALQIDCDVRDVCDINDPFDDFGDIVLWRSGSIDRTYGRTAALSLLKKTGRFVINSGVAKYPYVTYKLFQQKMVEHHTHCHTIPTFTFVNMNDLERIIGKDILRFPFIAKPNLGSRGEGVELIHTLDELCKKNINFSETIFQNFIQNTGDFRVLVLGGKPLGVMRRIAKQGTFLNNISQGGSYELVNDELISDSVSKIAVQIASLFDLAFCGIDIMYDNNTNHYVFLELNTVPQWQGFQEATGINIAREILSFVKTVFDRNIQNQHAVISQTYHDGLHHLSFDKRFHFLSRMHLFNHDPQYLEQLNVCKNRFIGTNADETGSIFEQCLANHKMYNDAMTSNNQYRTNFVQKYPLLGTYNAMLFKTLLSQTIYKEDITNILLDFVQHDNLLHLREKILTDTPAIQSLSTHAINYIYLLKNVFPNNPSYVINPEVFLSIIEGDNVSKNLMNSLYLLTHCIIGESAFYSQKILNDLATYKKMISLSEKIILENYTNISLDGKLEFLVCARLCNVKTQLRDMILSESALSYAEIGNYIVDTFNKNALSNEKKSFFASEHRNVLYLMATM